MKKLTTWIFLLSFLAACGVSSAAEIVRQKNAATYVVFPIVKNDGTLISSAAGLDSELDAFADGSAPDGFTDCTNEATEIGSTGQYYLSLAQSEMNNDYVIIQVKSTTTDAMVQTLLIRTMVGDVSFLATTDDGGAINVTSGKVDEVSTLTGHTVQTGNSYAIVNSGTYGNSALKTLIDAVPTVTEIQTEIEENGASILDTIRDKLPTNYIMGASAQTDQDDDISAILEDTGTTLDGLIDSILEDTGTTIPATLTAMSGATFDTGTDSLEALRNRGDAEWITATGFSTHSAADVKTALEADGSKIDHVWEMTEDDGGTRRLTTNALEQAPSGSGATAQEVWEYDVSSFSTVGYAGTYLKGAGSAGDPWVTALPGSYEAGTAGYILGTNLDEAISGLDDNPWDAVSRTLTAGTKDTEIDAILADTGITLPAQIDSWGIVTGQ